MSWLLAFAMQAAAAPAPQGHDDFDPARDFQFTLVPQKSCDEGPGARTNDPEEIVVCGSRGDHGRYRLPLTSVEDALPNAEFGIMSGVRAKVYVEGVEIAPGVISKRLMINFAVAF